MKSSIFVVAFVAASCGTAGEDGPPTGPGRITNTLTVGPNQSYTTIQAALNAATPDATIHVMPATYAERIVITKPIKLKGTQAVLDGLAGGLDGRFVGIEVSANNVDITGFIIQNYERGVVAESVANFRFHGNEVRNNTSKDPPPISSGVTKSDGVVLYTVQNSEIADNFIHDNGSIGLLIGQRIGNPADSSNNVIRRNRFVNNGTQQGLPGSANFGIGIQITFPSDQNEISDNDVAGSHWGIFIHGDRNAVRGNRITGNARAGIMIYGTQNVVENNQATGNGTANFYPSCRHELMDYREIDNTWRNNTGVFGSGEPPFVSQFESLYCS